MDNIVIKGAKEHNLKNIDITIPSTAPSTDNTAAYIITSLKLFMIRMADNAGNTSNAVIRREPTRFIARTIITAVITL